MTCLLCGEPSHTAPSILDDFFWFYKPTNDPCLACLSSFEKIAEPYCLSCHKPGDESCCSDCAHWKEQGFSVQHQALYHYNDAMKDYMSLYKFYGDYVLAQLFAKDLKEALKAYSDYAIVPVPVSSQTLAERGFNQVEGLLEAADIPFISLLSKGEGDKQSSRSREERLTADLPYALLPQVNLPKKVLIVDDVYTTGATLARIAQLLREQGVEEVRTFSLAR